MGEIKINIELENSFDRDRFVEKQIMKSNIRQYNFDAVVDTGSVMLVVPQDIVEKVGLKTRRLVIVTYADDRKEERPVAGPVTIKIGDRNMITECIIGPPASEILIGQVVLETLDLLADCQNQKLIPRPESPIYPMLKLK
ncbi:Clan AA aspartic protease [Candidatus Magnetomoraceae bacterium gMMP-13]